MKSRAILLASVLIVLFCAVFFLQRWVALSFKEAAADSTAAAIAAALDSEMGNTKIQEIVGNPNGGQQLLTQSQYDQVIDYLAPKHTLDAAKGWEAGNPLLDPWGKRFQITIRKSPDGKGYYAEVFSMGPDEKPNTGDDIGRPH
jgi:hypothetical protein